MNHIMDYINQRKLVAHNRLAKISELEDLLALKSAELSMNDFDFAIASSILLGVAIGEVEFQEERVLNEMDHTNYEEIIEQADDMFDRLNRDIIVFFKEVDKRKAETA